MNGSEDSDADGIGAVGAAEGETRKRILLSADFEGTQMIDLEGMSELQWFQESSNGTTAIFDDNILEADIFHSVRINIG